MFISSYDQEGVSITPAMPSCDDAITLTYHGLLPKSGASEVYAWCSFNDDWSHAEEYKMGQGPSGFETRLTPPPDASSFSVCFKDTANNWDNNSGMNYTFRIHNTTLDTLNHLHSALDTLRRQATDEKGRTLIESLLADIDWVSDAYRHVSHSEVI